jgi:ankyrin repeat protein
LYEACKIGTEKEIEKAFSVFRHQPLFNLGEIKDQDGITPLHIVALSNHSRALKSVLNYTPDTLVEDYLGQTPLHKAAQGGNDKNIKRFDLCLAQILNAKTQRGEGHYILLLWREIKSL